MDKNEILSLIKNLIEKTTVSVVEIGLGEELGKEESGSEIVWVDTQVKEPHLFLDRGGEALSALNHLVHRIIEGKNPTPEKSFSVMIDINGFQKKKIENLRAVAHMMAERARYFKSNIEVDPMSAFERRIIHEFLANASDLKTESTGTGPSRRVVIKYIGS